MKNKLLVMMVMLIGIFIGVFSKQIAYAACTNCNNNKHTSCTATSWDYTASIHKKVCCCESVTISGTYGSHTYGGWKSNGYGVSHSRTCSACSYKQTESHSYGSWEKYDESYHRRYCSKCNSYGSSSHTATTAATCTTSAYCGTCGSNYGSSLGHDYSVSSVAQYSSTQHYTTKCSRCDSRSGLTNHTWNISAANCTTAKSCTACGYVGQSALGHSYTVSSVAQCNANQHYTTKCSRCDSRSGLTNHTWNISSATCTTAKSCTACGYVGQAALGHSYTVSSVAQYDATYHYTTKCSRCDSRSGLTNHTWNISAATCTTAKSCTACGYVGQSALGHSYTVSSVAQCNANQHYTTKCSRCDSRSGLTNHTWNISSATCTTAKSCTACGYVGQSALGHDYSVTSYSSYSSTQHYTKKCSRCDSRTSLASHTWNISAANCTAAKSCTACGYVGQSALGHDYSITEYSSYSSTQHYTKKCSRCTSRSGITNHTWNISAANCTTAKSCTACGYVGQAALGHDYSVTSYSSYSSTQHYTKKCSRCDSRTSLASHTWNSGVTTTAATCIAKGSAIYTCTASGCGQTKTGELAINSSNHASTATTTTYSKNNASVHNVVVTYNCCGATKSSTTAAHTWNSGVTTTASTCITKGSAIYTCTASGCGQTKTGELALNPSNHASTATTTTYSKNNVSVHNVVVTYNCCGATKSSTTAAHTWNSGVTTTSPTCTTNGVKTYTCTTSGCGQTKTEAITALGHSRIACPTCNTANILCTVCNDVASHTCDNAPPTVSASNIIYGNKISATLRDTQSGVSYWQVTTSNSTPTSNWIEITNTKETTVSESSIRNVGTYYVWAKDFAGYTGSAAVTVSAKNVSGLTATLGTTSYVYNGTARTPSVTVKDGSTTLTNGTDYTVSYSNNTNAGSGKVTITGKGNYTGTKELTFSITQATPSISLTNKSATYTGGVISIDAATVSGVSGGTTPSGTITYKYYTDSGCTTQTTTASGATTTGGAPKNVGTYYVKATIAAAGNYTSNTSAAATLTITTKSILASGVTATLGTTSYVYNGTARTPSVTVKDGSTTLTNGTDYTVSYSNNKDFGTGKVTITGKGNYAGTKELTFSITQATPSISLTEKSATYTGSVISIGTATVSGVSGGTIPSGAITYKYYTDSGCTTQTTTASGATATGGAPKNVGTYYVKATIAAAGNYASNTSAAVKLIINAKVLSDSDITVSLDKNSYVYDRTAKTPTPTVKYGSITLINTTDYTVGYSNNIDVGTATVTITGKGNYTGTKTVTFTITIATLTLTVSSSEYNISKGTTVTPTYSYNGNGNITASSSTSSIATATANTSENKVTIQAVGSGNTTITINASATKQYIAVSKNITVRVFEVANVSDVSTTVGKSASFTASLINPYSGSTYTYQWQLSTNGGTSWSSISGATNSIYTVTTTETMNGYQYRCVVKNNAGYSITSNVATLTTGWDISKNGDGSVIAYLTPSGSNYIMTISGTGEMKDYVEYNDVPWINYRTKISELLIKEGVTSIGDRAFFNFTLINNITLPSTIKDIGSYAFYNCTGVTGKINIPKAVTTIGSNPFLTIPVTGYIVESGNTAYKAVDGVLFNTSGTTLISYPAGATATSYVVPNGVTSIGEHACNTAKFTSVTLPNSLVSIHGGAFRNSKITSVTIPESVKYISSEAFKNATSLGEVFFETTTVNRIDNEAFDNLKSGSTIYTLSKDIANKFVDGTNYTAANTNIYYPPTITKHPANVKSIWGATATFNVEIEEGNPNASYQWYKNGVAISGATSSSYTTPALTASDNGATFYCLVYNAEYYRNKGVVKSNVANLIAIDGRYSIIRSGEELYYDSLQLVLDSVLDGETIDVRKNIASESDATLTGNKTITFNTNNYFITMENGANLEIGAGSKVTITGSGTIRKTVNDSTSLIANNGTLEVTGNVKMSNTYGYILDNAGIATLSDGEYRGAMPIHAKGNTSSKVTINSENVKIIAEGNMVPENGAITLEGGSKLELVNGIITASATISEVRGILVKENSSADILGGTITASSSNSTNQGDAIGIISTGNVNVSGETSLNGSRGGITLLDSNTGNVNITGGTIIGGQVGIFNNSNAKVSIGNNMDEVVETTVPVIRGEQIAYVSLKNNSNLSFYDGVLQSAGGKNVIYQDVISIPSNVITEQNITQIENDITNTHKLHFADGTINPTYPTGYDIHLVTQQIDGKTYDIGYLRLYTSPIVNGPNNTTIKLAEKGFFQVTAVGGVPSKYTYKWQVSIDNGRTWVDIADTNDDTYETPLATPEMNSNMYRCIVSNGIFNVESREVMLTIDEESLLELPIDIVPIGKYTFLKGNTISKVDGKDVVELEFVVKSTSPLNKLVMNDTEINLNSDINQNITDATIRKTNYIEIKNSTGQIAEYAYSFYMTVNKNGIYTATFEDNKGRTNTVTQTIDTFNETPLTIEYTLQEPTLYREYSVITFIANRDVKFVSPEAYKEQIVKIGNGEYANKYTLDIYSEINGITFTFADKAGYTKEVAVSTDEKTSKNIRLTSDSTSLGAISINDAYERAQELEEKVELNENNNIQVRYGVSSVQVDMFMSRARDVGAAVLLSNVSTAKAYDVSLPENIEGGSSSKISTYGISGISNEYVAAFNANASGTEISKAAPKYVDILKGSRLNLYKGLTINGFSMSSTSQPYAIMSGGNSGSNVANTANNGISFRVTIINK